MLSFLKKMELKKFEIFIIFCILFVHILLAMYIGLSPDEAHYALYAKFLDWSYFDHPPMVGWLQYTFYTLSESELSLRILPLLSWLLSLALIIKMTQKIKSYLNCQNNDFKENGFVRASVLIYLFSPLLHLLSFALVPDTLLIPLILMGMICTWDLLQFQSCEQTSWKNWVYLGLILGFAGLTKYTSVFFAMSIAVLIIWKFGLKILLKIKLWTAATIALICITPVIFWNDQHDWISFKYQLNHAAGSADWLFGKCVIFLMVLIIAYGPLLLIGLFKKTVRKETDSLISEIKVKYFFFIFSLPSLFILIILSGRGSTLPHWAAPALVALIPFVAIKIESFKNENSKIYNFSLIFQIISSFILILFLFTAGIGQEQGNEKTFYFKSLQFKSQHNPFADLFGWKEAGEKANKLIIKNEINKIAVSNWTLASRIAWYARPTMVNVIEPHRDQFDIWFGTLKTNDTVLWLDWSMMPFKAPTDPNQFESCELIEQLPIIHLNRQISHFNFSICKGWKGGENEFER